MFSLILRKPVDQIMLCRSQTNCVQSRLSGAIMDLQNLLNKTVTGTVTVMLLDMSFNISGGLGIYMRHEFSRQLLPTATIYLYLLTL